ncbi:MAG: transcription antitermination factor NusB [Chlamydiota bacterium]
MISPARSAAYDILLRVERHGAYASELLHSSRYEKLSPADHALCTEVVMGVLRWRSALDAGIEHFASQRLEKLDVEVLVSLRLGAYQMGWLERVPARAAIYESVELAKRARKRSAAPFVNAVLRKMSADRQWKEPLHAPLAAALRERLQQLSSEQAGWTFYIPHTSSASEAQSWAQLWSHQFAHPAWLVERWCAEFGGANTLAICRYDQQVPVTAIRLRVPGAEEELRKAGIELAPGAFLADARRVSKGEITRTAVFREGRIAIQDEASQLVAAVVGGGRRLLDCCAAPGGKTAILADRNPDSQIIAADLHPQRARLLRQLIRAQNVQVIAADAAQLPVNDKFDRALADVPCSGTGTLARNPEIKWRLQPCDLADLHARQVTIARSALAHLAPGGRLVYSTCSLEREENQGVVEELLATVPTIRLLNCRTELEAMQERGQLVWQDIDSITDGPFLRTLPGVHPCDGFFAAILEKTLQPQRTRRLGEGNQPT